MSIDFAIGEQRSQNYWNKRSADLQGKAEQDYRDPHLPPVPNPRYVVDASREWQNEMIRPNNPPTHPPTSRETTYEKPLSEEQENAAKVRARDFAVNIAAPDPDPSAVSEPEIFGELFGSADG